MAVRNTTGATAQAWTLVAQAGPQTQGNFFAIWCIGAGTAIVTFADGSGPFTLTLVANTLYTFPYPMQIFGAASTATGVAFGYGAPPNG